jgi:hypothetical protein
MISLLLFAVMIQTWPLWRRGLQGWTRSHLMDALVSRQGTFSLNEGT